MAGDYTTKDLPEISDESIRYFLSGKTLNVFNDLFRKLWRGENLAVGGVITKQENGESGFSLYSKKHPLGGRGSFHPFQPTFNTANPSAVTFTLEPFIVSDLENPSVILPVKDADESYLTGNNHYIWIEREYDAAGDPVDDIIIKSVDEGSVEPTFASGQWEIELALTEDDVPVTYQKFWRYLVAKVEIVVSDEAATVTVTQFARNNLRIFDRFYNFFPVIYPLPI